MSRDVPADSTASTPRAVAEVPHGIAGCIFDSSSCGYATSSQENRIHFDEVEDVAEDKRERSAQKSRTHPLRGDAWKSECRSGTSLYAHEAEKPYTSASVLMRNERSSGRTLLRIGARLWGDIAAQPIGDSAKPCVATGRCGLHVRRWFIRIHKSL